MKKDIHHVWKGDSFQFTLNKIAAISGGLMQIPECFRDIADQPIARICSYRLAPDPAKGLNVRFLPQSKPESYEQYVSEAENGVVIITHKELVDDNGHRLPAIVLPSIQDVQSVLLSVGRYLKTIFPMPTIAMTGSVGKTTTTLFLESIFTQRNRVFVSGRNLNISEAIIERMVESYGPNYDFHIQETGGGGPGVVTNSAKFLTPDAFAVLNIYPHHLDKYKTVEGIRTDKTSLDRFANANAFGVINIDDDLLRTYPFKNRVVTCGIQHREADYVAENIRQDGIYLCMDIVYRQTRVPIRINIPGSHNAYNAVVAFAMAKEWGLTDEEIQDGFLSYKSVGIRQNLCEIAGRTMYIDCFNISVDSIRSCMAALDTLEPKPGCRRIAVLGGENALGDNSFPVNYEVGLEMAKYKADEFIFIGLPKTESAERINRHGDGRSVFEGARRVVRDRPVSFIDDLDLLADKLMRETKPGDVILFKGIFRLPMFAAIDRAFGTSILLHEPMFAKQLWRSKGYSIHYYKDINGSNIISCRDILPNITIPNTVIGKPVYRIGDEVFSKRREIKSVDFNLSVQNIGTKCFYGCTHITSLQIPANVIYVEEQAFAECTALEHVSFDGVLHIEKKAFYNCKKLKTVRFTDSCQTIEHHVFAHCPNLTIIAPENSVAHRYAIDNGIAFQAAQ